MNYKYKIMFNFSIMLLLFAFVQLIIICVANNCQNQTLLFASNDVYNVTNNGFDIDWFSEDDLFSEDEYYYVDCQSVYLNISNIDKEKSMGIGVGLMYGQHFQYETCYNHCNITVNCSGISNITIMFGVIDYVMNSNETTFSYAISSIYETCAYNDTYTPYAPYSYPNDNDDDINIEGIVIICIIGGIVVILVFSVTIIMLCCPEDRRETEQTQQNQQSCQTQTKITTKEKHNDDDMIELDDI